MGLSLHPFPLAASPLVLAALLSMSTHAMAQQGNAQGQAKALFDQGRQAREAGDCAGAIPLFRQSQSLYPGRASLFNLAECEEQVGKIASALQHFEELIPQLDAGDERLAIAQDRVATLKGRIPHLRLELGQGTTPPKEMTLDGAAVDPARLGTRIPLDPGIHIVVVTWPDGETQQKHVTLVESRQTDLRLSPSSRAVASKTTPMETSRAADSSATTSSPLRTLGFVVGGVGIAALGVSAVTGFMAIAKKSDLEKACPDPSRCTHVGLDMASSGQTLTTISTVGFFVGLAGLAAGTTLVLTAPSDARSVAVTSAVWPGGGAMSVGGRF